jgi:hypothetical protein
MPMMNTVTDVHHVSIAPIHMLVAFAVAARWPSKAAFEAAMLLLCHGVTVAEARAMFDHCERWRQ